MFRKLGRPSLLIALVSVFAVQLAHSQSVNVGRHSHPRITQNIDESKLLTLRGNTHRDARKENDRGSVQNGFPMEHMQLQLQRSPEQEQAVQKFIDALHNSDSPEYHKWLTAEEFGDRFGISEQDLNTLTNWLMSHGFRINVVYPSGMVIDFSGTAEQVRQTFGTEIRHFEVRGEKHVSNVKDPQIPAALAPVVAGVVSMHDFRPHVMHKMRGVQPKFTSGGLFGSNYAVVPGDLATIYNLNPLFSAGYSGQGQTIVLIEDTDVFSAADWSTFRTNFGLSSYTSGSFQTVHPAPSTGPNNCAGPGVIAPNDAEAILDAEWASAAAPSAAIVMASCADTTTTFGGLIAVQNLINASNPPAIMSISYGECETVNGAAANAAYNSAYQQAVAEGVSVFVAAGDSGASGCDNSAASATHGIGANAFASTPYNVAVGGTDFSDTYSGTNDVYWNPANTSTFASAQSYIPEIPWNNSCAGALLSNYLGFELTYGSASLCNDSFYGPLFQTTVAGGGSPSACATGAPSVPGVVSGSCQGWPKPPWQSVLGNPNDGVRDTPDVSLFAADGLWSHFYVFCWSDTANGGAACTGDPSGWSGAGGTSFSAPILAGIQALVNQKMGAPQGNPNPVYYDLAAAEYGSGGATSCNSSLGNAVSNACIFYDVTQGDMDVNCTSNNNCYNPSGTGTQGVLSTSNSSFNPAYGTTIGWDFATGIGTLNAANLVNNWPAGGPSPGFLLSTSPSGVTVTQGGSATSTISVVPRNGFSGSVSLSASGLPSGVTASFNPSSTTNTSTVTFTASGAATVGTSNVTITGTAGALTATTTVSLTVNPVGTFTLSASSSNVSVSEGGNGTSTITVTPQNGFNSSVSLSASGLPSGVTASFNPTSTNSTSTLTFSASGAASIGTFTVTVTGSAGSLTKNTTIGLSILPPLNPSIPSGWYDLDVGTVSTTGSAKYANGVFTLSASGQWIFNTADGMHFAYQGLNGDGTIVARVVSATGSPYPQAGVMVRETLNGNSAHAFVGYEPYPSASMYFYERASTGASTTYTNATIPALPYWVKLVRSGSNFSGYISGDGVSWVQVGTTQTINMAQSVYIGLALSANNNNSAVATATFDSVSISTPTAPAPSISSISPTSGGIGTQVVITGSGFGPQGSSMVLLNDTAATANAWSGTSISINVPAGATTGPLVVCVAPTMNCSNALTFTVLSPLPNGWLDQDVGQVNTAGTAKYSNGVFTLSASGQWIYGTADGMHFAYQALSGDGTIVARVVSASGSAYPEAGVMVRETLNGNSAHAFVGYEPYPSAAMYFYERLSTGASTGYASAGIPGLPYWVKLVRSGSNFSGYISGDGVSWVQVGTTQTISMAQSVYIGLALSANNNSAVATSSFDNVAVTH